MTRQPRLLGRLRRCSWLTWCAAAVASLAMTLIAVPGDPVYQYSPVERTAPAAWSQTVQDAIEQKYPVDKQAGSERRHVEQYEHGWPLPCLVRGIGRVMLSTGGAAAGGQKEVLLNGHPPTTPALSIRLPSDGDAFTVVSVQPSGMKLAPAEWETATLRWSDYNRWPLAIDAAEWRFGSLVVNVVVALAIVFAAGALTEWWVRRRGGPLRFRLTDLVVAFAVCGSALAWYQSHATLRRAEQRFESQASWNWLSSGSLREDWEGLQQCKRGYSSYRRESVGPDWLWRLLGNREFLRFSKHITSVRIVPDESWGQNIDVLPKLTRVETVSFPRGITRRAVEQLKQLPRLRRVEIGVDSIASQRSRDQAPLGPGDRWMGGQDLAWLRSLAIEELGLAGRDLLAEDLDAIASMPALKRLELIEPSLTSNQLDRLRRDHPGLKIESVWAMRVWVSYSPATRYEFIETPLGSAWWMRYIKKQRAEADKGMPDASVTR